MSLSKKEVREITGFTFSKIGTDPENWMKRAVDFKEAAKEKRGQIYFRKKSDK